MKKVYLIGDSIRMGYAPFVRAALKDRAEVYWPPENCRFAAYTYYALGDWEHNMRIGEDLDVVHWNAGLHDVVRFAEEEPVTPPEIYAYYLKRIYKRLKFLYPSAKQIFATTTPVNEELYGYWLKRKNAEVDAVNAVVPGAFEGLDIEINDLHKIVRPEHFSDATHFNTPQGREAMTKAVLKSICPYLGIKFEELTMPDFSDEGLAALEKAELLA